MVCTPSLIDGKKKCQLSFFIDARNCDLIVLCWVTLFPSSFRHRSIIILSPPIILGKTIS